MITCSRRARAARRSGFTLLELLLAAVLASMLLAALYLAMSVTIRQTQVSRDAGEVEHLPRGIFNKMTVDLSGTLAPLPPKSGGNSAASGGTSSATASGATASSDTASGATTSSDTGATTGSAGSAAPATDSTGASGGSTSTPSATDALGSGVTDTATAVSADYSFQGGVYGTEKQIVVYTGRTPETFTRFGNPGDQVRSDQRQIIYWLGDSGGLYRQERPWITADGVRDSIEPDREAPDAILLAEEVKDLSFEYTDGSSWATEWDGTAPGPDGVTPLGPPRAIRVTLTLKISLSRNESVEKQMTHVIPIRAAPGTYTVPLIEAPVDGATDGTTGSGTTDGSNGGTGGAGAAGGTAPSTGAAGGAMGGAGGAMGGGRQGGGGGPGSGQGGNAGGAQGGRAGGGMGGGAQGGGGQGGGRAGGGQGGGGQGGGGQGGGRAGGGQGGGNTGGGRAGGSTGGGR